MVDYLKGSHLLRLRLYERQYLLGFASYLRLEWLQSQPVHCTSLELGLVGTKYPKPPSFKEIKYGQQGSVMRSIFLSIPSSPSIFNLSFPSIRTRPQRSTIVSILALSMIRTLAPTTTAPVPRVNVSIMIWELIDIGIRRLMTRSCEPANRGVIGMNLPIRPSVVVGHQRLEPDGVASISLSRVPVACEGIAETLRITPRIAECGLDSVVHVRAQSNGPGLGNGCRVLGCVAATIAVEALPDLLPRVIPIAPVVGREPCLNIRSAGNITSG
jgi:hypothetical protein